MGIAAFVASNWTIGPDVEIAECWGDGIYVGSDGTPGAFCENFTITGVHVRSCRRNGISIVAGRRGQIGAVRIEQIGGTAPAGGIDLEPDHREHPNRDIRIFGGTIARAAVGIYVTVANQNIVITGMTIDAENSGIIIGDHSAGVRIEDNPRIASTVGGDEGAALRTVVADPASVRGLHLRGNLLAGGGHFVLDLIGDGFRDLVVSGNRIEATNRGTQGVARMGAGTFTDNACLVAAVAGKANEHFMTLSNVAYGRNSYRNLSPHRMHNIIWDGRDLGGERYLSATLRPWLQRR